MAELDNLTIQISASTKAASTNIGTLISSLESLNTALSGMNVGSLSTLAEGTAALSSALSSYKGQQYGSVFTSLANGLGRIAAVNGASLTGVANGLTAVSGSLNGMTIAEETTAGIVNLASAVSRLGSGTVSTANYNLVDLQTTLGNLFTMLEGFQEINCNIPGLTELVASISRLGGKTASQAAANIPQLETALRQLIETLSKAPEVSANTLRLVEALAQISSQSKNVSSSSSRLSTSLYTLMSGFTRSTSSAKSFHFNIKKLNVSFNSLAAVIGKVYANCWLIYRVFQRMWKLVSLSMNWKEITNYFNKAITDISTNAVEKFSEAGEESAEAYYNSFSETMLSLTEKMSGYTISSSGSLVSAVGSTSLGLNPSDLLNYQTIFAQMANSIGEAEEYTVKLSNAMTMLGADLSSVKNVNFTDTWENLSSGVMSSLPRAIDKFGINVRSAALDTELLTLGIDATSASLNQEEKTLLRAIIALDSSRYAWGDLADTINTPANSLKVLKANFTLLGQYIGNIFLPIVANAIPYVNALVVALQRVTSNIVNLLGYADFDWGSATTSFTDAMSDVLDAANEASDGIEEVQKATNDILGFDEINKLSDETSSSADAATGSAYLAALQKAFDDIYAEYQEVWNKAYASVTNDTQTLANKIFAALKKAYENDDWTYLGEKLGDKINESLIGIDWTSVGKSIGGSMMKLPTLVLGFVKRTSWKKVGDAVAKLLNGAFKAIDFDVLGELLAEGVNGAVDFVITFLDEFDLDEFASNVIGGINTFLKKLDVKKLAKGINKIVSSAWTLICDIVKDLDWGALFNDVATLISQINWAPFIAIAFVKLNANLISGITSSVGPVLQRTIALVASEKIAAGLATAGETALKSKVLASLSSFASGAAVVGGVAAIVAAYAAAIISIAKYQTQLEEACTSDVIKAWADDGTTSITTLETTFATLVGNITEGMDSVNTSFESISDSKESIESTTEELAEMYNAIETGYLDAQTSIPEFIDLVNSVYDQTKDNLDSEYNLIVLALAGSFGDSLTALGYDVPALIELLNEGKAGTEDAITAAQSKIEGLTSAYENGAINAETYWRGITDAIDESGYLDTLTGVTQATDDSMAQIKQDYNFNDWVTDGTLDTDAVDTFFNNLKTTYSTSEEEINTYYENLKTALSDLAGTQLTDSQLSQLTDSLLGTDDVRQANLDEMNGYIAEIESVISEDLVDGMETAITQAQTDYDNLNWFQKIFVGDKDTYVRNAVKDYKEQVVDPISEEMQTQFADLGIDVGTTASDTADSIIDQLFTSHYAGGDYNRHIEYTLTDDWETILANTKKNSGASDTGKSIIDDVNSGATKESASTSAHTQQLIRSHLSLKNLKTDFKTTGSDAADSLTTAATTGIKNKRSDFYSSGTYVLEGLSNGLNNQTTISSILSNITSVASNVISKFKEKLGIHSPSKVFEEMGGYTVEGYNEGISKNISTTEAAMKAWSDSISGYELDTGFMNTDMSVNTNAVIRSNSTIVGGTLDALVEKVDSLLAKDTNISVTADVNLEGDAKGLFKKVQSEAKTYSAQTGKVAFA